MCGDDVWETTVRNDAEACELSLRIAFHFPDLSGGGVEKMRIVLARELISRGHEVDFVLCSVKGEHRDAVPSAVHIHDLAASRTLKSVIPLVRYLRSRKPTILISSLGPQNLTAIVAGRLSGVDTKILVTQHNELSVQAARSNKFQLRWLPFFYRLLLPFADRVIAVSNGVADDLAGTARLARGSIEVLNNPSCPKALPKARSDHPVFSRGRPVALAVGRLVEQKGFDTLIKAIARVNKTMPLDLAILGSGPIERQLAELAIAEGIPDRVHLLGFQQDPLSFMKAANVFVMSSRHEGFPNVLVEALSCGTPVVSTDCRSGPSEILLGGAIGLLTPVDDVDALGRAIIQTLETPIDSSVLEARASDFSIEKITDDYMDLIVAALSKDARPSSRSGALLR